MSLSNGSETEFLPEDSGMKVEKQREIRAKSRDLVTKQYKTMSLMRWRRGMVPAQLKKENIKRQSLVIFIPELSYCSS